MKHTIKSQLNTFQKLVLAHLHGTIYLFSCINQLLFTFPPHARNHFLCAAEVASSEVGNNLGVRKRENV